MGFHDSEQIDLVDLENTIQPLHRHDDAAAGRHRPAGVPGTRAANHQRHPMLVA